MKRAREMLCWIFGHNDKPLVCRVNDGPWILTGVDCRRCYRTLPVGTAKGTR